MTEMTRRDFVRDGAIAAAGAVVGLSAASTVRAGNPDKADTGKILNYNPDMEYRRCGKTNLMVSAVCLGGHWKNLDVVLRKTKKGTEQNRYEVISRCIERGINYVDACTAGEVMTYAKAMKGRRDKMYFGYSWYEEEMRKLGREWNKAKAAGETKEPGWITKKLQESFDYGLKQSGLEYVDLWRVVCIESLSQHSDSQLDEMVAALEWAKKSGRARFTGMSSHDPRGIKKLIEKYPQIEVICMPYTAKTKLISDESGLFAALKKHDVGWFGIKPFASNSLFKPDPTLDGPNAEENNRIARLAIRYILCNPAITAPIPGLISVEQVDNVALAVKERRQLDQEEKAELDAAMDRAWASLPQHYQWLKDWEYV